MICIDAVTGASATSMPAMAKRRHGVNIFWASPASADQRAETTAVAYFLCQSHWTSINTSFDNHMWNESRIRLVICNTITRDQPLVQH